ncbi:MAG: hypothetical protein M1834_002359 [Cirrosporium novae-zelandiae]|nr:MAG: hypothetical protein M1834_002359 [Cirrosporium novae-zelandiae]
MSTNFVSSLRSFSQKSKPVIDILLKNNRDTYVSSYTTLEKIEGEVSIMVPLDTKIDNIEITFEGVTKTWVEKAGMSAPTTNKTRAQHNFLKLKQPIGERSLPASHIAKAGQTYKFPFTFVVPEQLLPQVCSHRNAGAQIHDAHTRLPPSLGDPMLASDGTSLLDDLAPEMVRIAYMIKVKLTRNSPSKPIVLVEAAKKIRIIPAIEEEPPLHVSDDEEYCLRKEKDVKKGVFKGKTGRITIEASQPKAFYLPAPGSDSSTPNTMATVNLRFDPAEANSKPPRLATLFAKLKITTYFSTQPMHSFPTHNSTTIFDSTRGFYDASQHLSSRCIESAQWHSHTSPYPDARRDSVTSTTASLTFPSPSLSYTGSTFYTASVLVPISLPSKKAFVPTFHSCLVSRVYKLDLGLSYHTSSGIGSTSLLSLKVPIQIAAMGNPNATATISSSEAHAIAAREAVSFFVPRSVAPPSPDCMHPESLSTPSSASSLADSASFTSSSTSASEVGDDEGATSGRALPTADDSSNDPPVYAFSATERWASLGLYGVGAPGPIAAANVMPRY